MTIEIFLTFFKVVYVFLGTKTDDNYVATMLNIMVLICYYKKYDSYDVTRVHDEHSRVYLNPKK